MNAQVKKTEKPFLMVTGAAGSLARQTIQRLRDHYRVVAVDFRTIPDLGRFIPGFQVDFNKRDFEDLFREFHFKAVLHLGRIEGFLETNLNRYNANVLGTQRLLDLCIKYKVDNVLVLSSFHVYGANQFNPAPIDETAPLKASELTMKLVDLVELDNLARIYLWEYPQLNIKLIRPCHIVGPGMRNSFSQLLSSRFAPVLMGFSPVMQLIHSEDMARALEVAVRKNKRGVYNVAPSDWIALQEALKRSGCNRVLIPSIPAVLPKVLSSMLGLDAFPSYLMNFFKYPVIIDPSFFNKTFTFKTTKTLEDIFNYYSSLKK